MAFKFIMQYYYQKGFTYIELGDADELWENRSMQGIKENHMQSFEMLSSFLRGLRNFCFLCFFMQSICLNAKGRK